MSLFSPLQQAYGASTQFDRAQQVNEALVAIPHCRAVNPDRSLLEVGVLLRDGSTTSLRISLPAGFPKDRPAMAVTSPVRHNWVDIKTGRLSFTLLEHWGSYGTRLAAVVQEALKGLGGEPAPPPSAAAHGSGIAQPSGRQQPTAAAAVGGPSALGTADTSPQRHGSQTQQLRLPALPQDFPQLQALGNEELSEALCDEAAYRRLVDSVCSSINVTQVADDLRAGNLELAQSNLGKEEQMADIRNQMAIIRSSEYGPAKAAHDEFQARQQAVLSQLAPEVLMARLAAAATAADEESSMLAQQLESGELGVDRFVEQYIRVRALYHQRDLKHQAATQTIPTHE